MIRFTAINNQIATNWPAIKAECLKKHDGYIDIIPLEKAISNQQMKFFHAVVVPLFVEYSGDSPAHWEMVLKVECGSKWFTPQTVVIGKYPVAYLPSKTSLSTKQFCEWYQNIVDYGLKIGVTVPPPDPEWKKKRKEK